MPTILDLNKSVTVSLARGNKLQIEGVGLYSMVARPAPTGVSGTGTVGPFDYDTTVYLCATGTSLSYRVVSAAALDTSKALVLGTDASGRPTSLLSGDTAVQIALTNPRRRAVAIGDSLTDVASGRATGNYEGQTYWYLTTVTGFVNWVSRAMADSRTPSATGGQLETDGAGRMRWQVTGDTPGAYVDVTQGGWFQLKSGSFDSTHGAILVHVRGATVPPAASTAAVTMAGNPTLVDWDTRGYFMWLAGMLGDTFTDYQVYSMSGATTADILKFTPQALADDVEAVFLLMGVNDLPGTAAAAAASITNIKATIDLAAAKARRVYVADILPYPGTSQTVQTYLARVSSAIREYCRVKQGCVFWSAYHQLFHPNAATVTSWTNARTGAYQGDSLHLMPYGAYLTASCLLPIVQGDYRFERQRKSMLDTYDATLRVGAWNANPTLRGVAGSVTASNGITGTAPDGWSISRNGASQLCTTSFDAAPDGGADFWCMAVSGASVDGEYHQLSQSVSVPAGVVAGDYVRLVAEILVGDCSGGAGLNVGTIHSASNSNLQLAFLFRCDKNIAMFTTEKPVLQLSSEPMRLLAGVTSFNLFFRVGGAAGGGTGKLGMRNFRIEKCGPLSI